MSIESTPSPLRGLVHAWMNSVQKNVVDMEEMFQLLSQEPEVKVQCTYMTSWIFNPPSHLLLHIRHTHY